MGVNYKEVRNDRQWKATTGLSQAEFNSLTLAFGQAYERLHQISLEQGAQQLKQELALSSYADCLYFVLFELKTGLTHDCLGVVLKYGWFIGLAQLSKIPCRFAKRLCSSNRLCPAAIFRHWKNLRSIYVQSRS